MILIVDKTVLFLTDEIPLFLVVSKVVERVLDYLKMTRRQVRYSSAKLGDRPLQP